MEEGMVLDAVLPELLAAFLCVHIEANNSRLVGLGGEREREKRRGVVKERRGCGNKKRKEGRERSGEVHNGEVTYHGSFLSEKRVFPI